MRTFRGGILVGGTLGLVAGLGAGHLLWFADVPSVGASDSATPEVLMVRQDNSGITTAAESPEEDNRASMAGARARRDELERELEALKADLGDSEARRRTLLESAAEARAPIPFPEDLPVRFLQKPLREAIDAALDELGGEVVAVDCTEYPCAVHSKIPLPEDPSEFSLYLHLRNHPAMSSYADDNPLSMQFGGTEPDGTHIGYSSVSFLPAQVDQDDQATERMMERLRQRTGAWAKSVRPASTSGD